MSALDQYYAVVFLDFHDFSTFYEKSYFSNENCANLVNRYKLFVIVY